MLLANGGLQGHESEHDLDPADGAFVFVFHRLPKNARSEDKCQAAASETCKRLRAWKGMSQGATSLAAKKLRAWKDMSQGTTSQAAKRLRALKDMSRGATSQAAKRLRAWKDMSEGTTSVGPKSRFSSVFRAGFSRRQMCCFEAA